MGIRSFAAVRASVAIALSCLALVGLGWAITLERIAYERENALAEARVHNSNLALAFEEHTIRTLKDLDRMVRFIRREYGEHRLNLDAEYLADEGSLDLSVLVTAGVVDERGDVVVALKGAEKANVADREYFQHHKSHAGDTLHIGRPVNGRLTGRPVIHITRRIDRPDGRFGGVALVGINPDYFASFYNLVDLGPRGIVLLAGLDGTVRARRDGASISAGQHLADSLLERELSLGSSGSYLSRGRLDGVRRYFSYRAVRGYPLAVAVGQAEEHVLGAWVQRRRSYLAGGAAGTLVVLLFGAALLLIQRRHAAAAASARSSEARYRTTFDKAGVGIAEADHGGRFLKVNRKLCALLGYSQEELLSRSWLDVTHPEDAKRTIALIGQNAADPAKDIPPLEKRYLRKDGKLLWAAVSVAPVRSAQGVTEYFVTMLQDITARKQAETELREAEERFRELAENIREVFWLTDPSKNEMLYVSPAYEDIWGRSRESLYASPRNWIDAVHPADHERVLRAAQTLQASGEYAEEYRIVRPDGAVRWIRDRAFPVVRKGGEVYRIAGIAEDITAQRETAEALRESERRFRDMLGRVELVSLMLDREARVTYCNDYLLQLTGWQRDEVLGRDWFELFIPREHQHLKGVFSQLLEDLPAASHHENEILTCRGERRMIRWNNTVLRSAAGEVIGTASIGEDITESLRAQAQVAHQAHYDALTDLPNRVLFQDRLEQAIAQACRHDRIAATLFIDIDHFKTVNDSLGHAVGDRLLQLAAKRLSECLRATDTVARFGGDEFAAVLTELASAQDAAQVAQKMLAAVAAPFQVDQHELYLSASIGIATFPADGRDGAELVRNADTAMFRAKEAGRDNYQFYTAQMNERAMEKLLLSNDLRRALARGEFLLHLQPKASLAEGRITGFEALLRWKHPVHGMVSPAVFIPLLEDSGLIVEVGGWAIEAACRQVAAWRSAGLEPLPVAINLSAKQFMHAGLAELLAHALAEHAVPRGLLELEITESHVMKNPGEAARVLGRLQGLGVSVAIDDFGTGYSSLSYLKRLPVDTLKIDRSFVSGLPDDSDDASIARAIITMAHSLGLSVVAEGVETQAQREFLARERCDQMQGYLLSRPLPAAEATRFLRRVAPKLAA